MTIFGAIEKTSILRMEDGDVTLKKTKVQVYLFYLVFRPFLDFDDIRMMYISKDIERDMTAKPVT